MKHFKFFPLLLIGLFYISNGCFSKNEDNFQIAFDFIPGEVFIRLSDGYNQSDLENIIDDFNVEIDRNLGDGYVISVPVDFEPLWITQFSSIPIVEESTYNHLDTIIYYRKKHILPLLITILYQLLLVIAVVIMIIFFLLKDLASSQII